MATKKQKKTEDATVVVPSLPTLRALPVAGLVDNPSLTVRAAREKLGVARIVIDRIIGRPEGFPAFLQLELKNVLFHINSGLAQADSYIGAGYYQDDSHTDVPGLEAALYNYKQAIARAQQCWDYWTAADAADKTAEKGAPALGNAVYAVSALPGSGYPVSTRPGPVPQHIVLTPVSTLRMPSPWAGVGADESSLTEFSKPKPIHSYIGLAAAACTALLLWKLLK